MGCLPSKQSTHVAIVHPLQNQPETSAETHQNGSGDTENKNSIKESVNINKNENLQKTLETKETETIATEKKNENSQKTLEIKETETIATENKNENSQKTLEIKETETIATENKNDKTENINNTKGNESKNEQEENMSSIENIKQKETEEFLDEENSLELEKNKQHESGKNTDDENKENVEKKNEQAPGSSKKQDDDDSDDNDDEDESEEASEGKPKKKNKKKILTEEEINQKWKESFENLQKHIDYLTAESNREKNENGDYNVKFRNTIYWMFKIHFNLKGAPYEMEKKYKKEYYKLLVSTGCISVIVEVTMEILKLGYRTEAGELIQSRHKPIINGLLVLINFSDSNPEDTHVMVDHPNFLDTLGEKITELEQKGYAVGQHEDSDIDFTILKKILSVLHNLGMADDNHDKLHSHNYVKILKPFLESSDKIISLASLATLADIIKEEESGILQTNPKILNALMNRLRKAMVSKTRREGGWSVCELCRTIRRIARNDANKKALVDHNAAEILVKVAADGYVEEQREAVGALRTLSFDKSNQQFFVSNPDLGVIDTFISLRNSPDKEVRKACEGALWTLRDHLSQHEKYKDSVRNITRVSQQPASQGQGHIMISYQWGNQPIMIKIKDILKSNGFKVWMDIDDMEGSTLNAMASAVEKASVILICYSQKYKDSDNCRAEAEYAFQLKKQIVPLKMEKNFKPDGWLGFIIGSRLFFDFSGKYSFESKIEQLLRELHSKLVDDKDTPDHLDITIPKVAASLGSHPEPAPVPPKQTTTSLAPVPTNTEVVKKWTSDQVKLWLDKHSLDKGKFSKITGIEIAFLQIVRKESPDFFYKSLTDMLKITDLLTMSKFVFALEDTNI